MAGRIYTQEEFDGELRGRGCTKTEHRTERLVAWLTPDGEHFLVPILPDGLYPDWMLDQIIEINDLPKTPLH